MDNNEKEEEASQILISEFMSDGRKGTERHWDKMRERESRIKNTPCLKIRILLGCVSVASRDVVYPLSPFSPFLPLLSL